MAPHTENEKTQTEYVLEETDNDVKTDQNYSPKIVWRQLLFHLTMHIFGFYGLYRLLFHAQWATYLWLYILAALTGQAIIIGAHRGYSHRSFKISKPMQLFFVIFETMAGQNSIFTWARDHRLHHKYSDTDADPHNISRGFFFAHVGWLLTDKHPLVREYGRKLDLTDLFNDKAVMFQHRYYVPLYVVFGLFVPIALPMYAWNETLVNSFFCSLCLRYIFVLNITWSINSVAHYLGPKTYDGRIRAVQSKLVWVLAFGEGWHNFHHAFPWDYRSTDIGMQGISTKVIELLNKVGLLSNLRVASTKVINGHTKRHGDGTHPVNEEKKRPDSMANLLMMLNQKED